MAEGILLKWDSDTERLYETGIRRGVLYPWDSDEGWYGAGVAWNGLTSVTETPSGAESNPIYADDIKYLDIRSAEEFGATIEAYTYPDEWLQCDGTANLGGAAGITIGQQSRKKFALCYRTVLGNDTDYNDYGYKLHLIYGCTASPSERQYQTVNDSPEAITFSWEVTTEPIEVDADTRTSIVTIDSTKLDKTMKSKLADLEKILYGTTTTTKPSGTGESGGSSSGTTTTVDPKIPTIEEIISTFGISA